MKAGTVLVAVVGLAMSASALAQKSYDTSANALGAPGMGHGRSLIYGTGFEAGEGFAVGGLPQNGWTEFVATPNGANISATHPDSGSQHLRITKDAAAASGTLSGGFSPATGALGAGHYVVSVNFATNDSLGADYDVVPQAPSQALLTARMKFSWLGDILVLDDTGSGLVFTDTGANWVGDGAYHNVTIDVDSVGNSLKYYYNGGLIYTGVAGVFAGTSVEQVVLISDNWQNSGEFGDFDNLSVTPAPAGLALLGLGGIGAMRRRRA